MTPPQAAAVETTGTSTTPDPPNLTPTGGAKDYLWIWAGGWEGEQTSPPAGSPTGGNYANNIIGANSDTAGAVTTNCRVALATRNLNAASENPPAWTISARASLPTAASGTRERNARRHVRFIAKSLAT